MSSTNAGFHYRYTLHGGEPLTMKLVTADAALKKGDMVNIESGQVDLAVTNDATLGGVCNETKAGMTTGTDTIECIVDPFAVYAVYDANARLVGATLDISGATGAQTVSGDTNHDLIVVAPSTATEETLVMINHGEHVFQQ